MSSATVTRLLTEYCSTKLRTTYAALLKLPAIEDPISVHATQQGDAAAQQWGEMAFDQRENGAVPLTT